MELAERHRVDEEKRFVEDESAHRQHLIVRKDYYDQQAHDLKIKKQNHDEEIQRRTHHVKSESNRIV
jgi:hypothetical protein